MAETQVAELVVAIKADASKATEELKTFEKSMKKIGDKFADIGKKMTVGLTLPIAGLGVAFAKSAMDLEATEAKYNTVFQGMTAEADAFIKKFQQLTPATTAEARSMASGIQDLLVPMGIVREEATAMSGDFMHVIGALTNFNSATHSAEDVTMAIQGAITGQYDSLKRLGIQLDATTIQQKAQEMGLISAGEEANAQQKAQVLLAEVYRQSSDALNAYNVESLDAKTKMGLLKAELVDVSAQFGEALLPFITAGIEKLREISAWFANLTQEQRDTIMTVLGIVAVLGPLIFIIGKVIAIGASLVTMFAQAKIIFLAVKGAFLAITAPAWGVIAVVAGLIAIGLILWTYWDEIKEFMVNAWNAIAEGASRMKEAITEKLTQLKTAMSKIFTQIWEGIKAVFLSFLKGGIPGLINDFILKPFFGIDLLQIGKDIINGLWNGIKSMGANLVKNIGNFVNDKLVQPFKDFLGIKSPSVLFRGFGVDTGKGYAIGIEKTDRIIREASVSMTQSAVQDFNVPEFDMPEFDPKGGRPGVELPPQIVEIHFGKSIFREIINGINDEQRYAGRTLVKV